MNKKQEKNQKSSHKFAGVKNSVALEEEKVLEFWEKAKTFEKSVEKEAPEGEYVFYDGPPFITGMPHYATLLPSIAKDMIPRYQTMKGKRVRRIWGWDCHGLPAENKVEQELGLKDKNDIEELGVGKFVDACRAYVDSGSEQWKWYIDRIARWVDMDNAYKTMDLPFMESVIWAFKQLYDKGLIYEGFRSSLHCPRCATPLSKFEITMDAGSYKDVQDESVIVKFKLDSESAKKITNNKRNVYILAWTTTPWTLPGNLALAVGENIEYVVARTKKDLPEAREDGLNVTPGTYIFAKDRFEDIIQEGGVFEEDFGTVKGKELLGLSYEPLFKLESEVVKNNKAAYRVYTANFVSTEDGTGVVHIAPNFGEDDFELGQKKNLPMVDLMNEMGHYSEEAGEFAGMFFKKAGREVMAKLEDRLFFREMHSHSYPFCYRCDSRLIFKTQKAWYLRISEIREQMLLSNQDINWVPEFFRDGRFKYNLENAPDWCLSRSRYWGSPIPVWRCVSCGELEVLGSLDEIEKRTGKRVKDLHRPGIDELEFACSECGDKMKRVKEVLDCWFESGSMPFAQFNFPFNQEEKVDFEKPQFPFPSDFIIEYTGQLRGWFYYLHVISNALFGREAFENVIVSGVLAGTDGRKMSKSYGNYPDPKLTLDKYGADALRIYFMQSSIMSGDDTSLNEKDIQDALRKNVMLLWNVTKFYLMFADDVDDANESTNDDNVENELDKWILARLDQLMKEITDGLENYDLPKASRSITPFIDDLSTWYIRRSRDRFKSGNEKDKKAALETTRYVLLTLSKLIAPLMPFVAERVWQAVTGSDFNDENKSVHLEQWPEMGTVIDDKKDDKPTVVKVNAIKMTLTLNSPRVVIGDMEINRKIVEMALAKRDEHGIKVRQPLLKLKVRNYLLSSSSKDLIQDEINVKEVVCEEGEGELGVELDTELTEDLRLEGMKREIVRSVNAMRKKEGLTISDRIKVFWSGSELIGKMFEVYNEDIKKETLADELVEEKKEEVREIDINGEKTFLGIEKA